MKKVKKSKSVIKAEQRVELVMKRWLAAQRKWRRALEREDKFLDLWELEEEMRKCMDRVQEANDALLYAYAR